MEEDVRTLELLDHVIDVVPRVDRLLDVVGNVLKSRPTMTPSSEREEVWVHQLDELQHAYEVLQQQLKKARPSVDSACPVLPGTGARH